MPARGDTTFFQKKIPKGLTKGVRIYYLCTMESSVRAETNGMDTAIKLMTMSKKGKDVKISYWAAHLTTIVSVTMLLVLTGVICLLGLAAGNTAREVKQLQQVSLVMQDSVTDGQAAALAQRIGRLPSVHAVSTITKEQALADWNESTGDDLVAIAGHNFLSPEIEISLKAAYTAPDSVAMLGKQLAAMPGVEEVVTPDARMITSMDSFLSRALLLLGVVAAAMIAISFVLINNTVLLTIYSRRFTIHTMQLVGATPGFIRRPFIVSNAGAGVLAGTMASAILCGVVTFVRQTQVPELDKYLSLTETALTCAGTVVAGGALCALAALIATNRYLHKDYDELFS